MNINRRNIIKGIMALGVTPTAATAMTPAQELAPNNVKVVPIRKGYFAVDGWVVSEREYRALREEGLC